MIVLRRLLYVIIFIVILAITAVLVPIFGILWIAGVNSFEWWEDEVMSPLVNYEI